MTDLSIKLKKMGYDLLGLDNIVYNSAANGPVGDCSSCDPGCLPGCITGKLFG
jgi:hypothetical protein